MLFLYSRNEIRGLFCFKFILESKTTTFKLLLYIQGDLICFDHFGGSNNFDHKNLITCTNSLVCLFWMSHTLSGVQIFYLRTQRNRTYIQAINIDLADLRIKPPSTMHYSLELEEGVGFLMP